MCESTWRWRNLVKDSRETEKLSNENPVENSDRLMLLQNRASFLHWFLNGNSSTLGIQNRIQIFPGSEKFAKLRSFFQAHYFRSKKEISFSGIKKHKQNNQKPGSSL